MPITKEEVAEAVRAWCRAWDAHDVRTIIAMEARASGFGFRPLARRDQGALGEQTYSHMVERFFGDMEYFHLRLENLQTSVMGDFGLAWGTHVEDFQEKGHPPELAKVRFTKILTKGEGGWQVVLYHRDIQPFGEDGRYLRSLTVVAPTPGAAERG
jgi:ketosteroid isomerase-like protein